MVLVVLANVLGLCDVESPWCKVFLVVALSSLVLGGSTVNLDGEKRAGNF